MTVFGLLLQEFGLSELTFYGDISSRETM